MWVLTDLVPQHLTRYMYRRTIYLSDLPQASRRFSQVGKPGSLSDPHRLRAEKPCAGVDFHLHAQQTEARGRKDVWKEVDVAPGCFLIRLGRRPRNRRRKEGVVLFGNICWILRWRVSHKQHDNNKDETLVRGCFHVK